MNILYIPGAFSTHISFNYIHNSLPKHNKMVVNYNSRFSLTSIIDSIFNNFSSYKELNIIGHSLGGIIALQLKNRGLDVRKIVTICSPFGGISTEQNILFHLLNTYSWNVLDYLTKIQDKKTFLENISTNHVEISSLKNISMKNIYSFVGCSGNALINEDNDGVVSVSSQTALTGPSYSFFNLNHFEVLLDESITQKIKTIFFA